MARSSNQNVRARARAICDRLEDKALTKPKAFKAHAKAFRAVQARAEAAAVAAERAESARDEALAKVADADEALDASLDTYADALSAAGLGPRQSPFKPFSKYTPSDMKALAYANEVKEVRALVAAVAKKKPGGGAAKAGAACLARATAVEKALKEFGTRASVYQKALTARDALLPELQKAITTLKTHAASAYADDAPTFTALFAPPPDLQAPKRRRAKKTVKPAPNLASLNGVADPAEET